MLRVGLLGAGRIGKVHAQAISANQNSELVAISDFIAEAADSLARSYGAKAKTTEDIIADDTIDAVLIATSTDTHADLIEAATAAGKAVLCEKPVDLDLKRAQSCHAAVKDRGRPIMIGFNRRFDPSFAHLKSEFDDGRIGKGELLEMISFDPGPPPAAYVKVSGGLFRDMAIHDFDMINWIFGGMPEEVTATGSSIVDPAIGKEGDVDTAVTTIKYADGRIACVRNSRRAAYGYDQRIELLGENGMLSVANVPEHNVTRTGDAGATAAKPVLFFLERYARAYGIEWAAFVDAVSNGTPVPVSLQDGVNALAVAEAATQSAKSGKTVRLADVI